MFTMKMRNLRIFAAAAFFGCSLTIVADNVTAKVAPEGHITIAPEIYGQFAEHLGSCIYGGLWVGPESPIPNTEGYRNDVLQALKDLHVPVLRWPGGCFADDYHWKDGIGPRELRPKKQNTNWGGTIEDNSFGTHEFLNLCELLGCEPYVSANVGSGTVQEMEQWVEYMNSENDTPMARLRRQNGRDKAWGVKYLGVGNESWGCGGNMRPEYYADLYRHFQGFARDIDGHNLYRIACGASGGDEHWTDVLMREAGSLMQGISVHYYTVADWDNHGKATKFSEEEYYETLATCCKMDGIISGHEAVMDKYDPQKRVGLMVDEWGTWWDVEDGTNPGHLYQQNTMRDAICAALSLNIFHRHAERVRMANIAQIVNVLQSMILTNMKGEMVLTPTYHVFEMYRPFQGATVLPIEANIPTQESAQGTLPLLSISAARTTEGKTVVAIVNASLDNEQTVDLDGLKGKLSRARILTSNDVRDYNDFGTRANAVAPATFKGVQGTQKGLSAKVPARSIVVIEIN